MQFNDLENGTDEDNSIVFEKELKECLKCPRKSERRELLLQETARKVTTHDQFLKIQKYSLGSKAKEIALNSLLQAAQTCEELAFICEHFSGKSKIRKIAYKRMKNLAKTSTNWANVCFFAQSAIERYFAYTKMVKLTPTFEDYFFCRHIIPKGKIEAAKQEMIRLAKTFEQFFCLKFIGLEDDYKPIIFKKLSETAQTFHDWYIVYYWDKDKDRRNFAVGKMIDLGTFSDWRHLPPYIDDSLREIAKEAIQALESS